MDEQDATPTNVGSNDQLGLAPKRMKFVDVCALMPEGVSWGDHLTPQIARELVEAGAAAERERIAATPIDYMAAIHHCRATLGHAQGTNGCIAFARGAEWALAQLKA